DTDTDTDTANAAPSGVALLIEPATPTTLDDLSCLIVTEAVDPNGDDLTYSYRWTVDGEDAGISDSQVGADNTQGGDQWSCTVRANDGELDGVDTTASVTVAIDQSCLAVDFDGTDGHIQASVPANDVLAFGVGWTMEGWFQIDATSTNDGHSRRLFGTSCNYNDVWVNSDGTLSFFRWPDSCAGSTAVNDGQWHHVAAVTEDGRGSNTVELYIDGTLDCTMSLGDMTSTFSGGGDIEYLFVGASSPRECGYGTAPAMAFLDGRVFGFRVQEGSAYTGGFTPSIELLPDASTRLLYLLDEGTGANASDSSSSGYDGTLLGGTTWVETCPE
ncbi:MAG TPA: hypothetical protein DFR83_10480, partial [Deltaproteobacteria bacterium]|nr:hypothetical protein [Deltaproteobacteria bacterium]